MNNIDSVSRFAALLRETANEGVVASSPPELVSLSLASVSPMSWQNGVELPIPASCVILPKGLGFDTQDVGKTFLFLQMRKDKIGKQYYFLCEREVNSGGNNS